MVKTAVCCFLPFYQLPFNVVFTIFFTKILKIEINFLHNFKNQVSWAHILVHVCRFNSNRGIMDLFAVWL